MEFFLALLLFFCKAVIIVVVVLALVLVLAFALKGEAAEKHTPFKMVSLNEAYEERKRICDPLEEEDKKARKQREKAEKEAQEAHKKLPRLFVINFEGDVEASDTQAMTVKISTVLQVAKPEDRVLLRLESGGGYVHSYGLAASQLARFKAKKIHLTVAVDKVAASGGYMMACVADELVAAPFAIIGSVGVVASIPNLSRLLKKHDVDYELHTAGNYKRTLTVFGENTEEGRQKFCEELAETHQLFKSHIVQMRPQLQEHIDEIATGETWYGQRALDKGLVDRIATSDDLVLEALPNYQVFLLKYEKPESWLERVKNKLLGRASLTQVRSFKEWIQ